MLKMGIGTRLQSRHQSLLKKRTVSIIGNAGDITERLLHKVSRSSVLFVCNQFAMANWEVVPQPYLYFLGDPRYGSIDTSQPNDDIAKLPSLMAAKFSYTPIFTSEGILNCFNRAMMDLHGRLFPISYIYAPYRGGKLGDYDYQLQDGLQEYQNILALMLQAAIYMGATNIKLYGFKFSNISNYPLEKDRHHFFDEDKVFQWRHKDNSTIASLEQVAFFRDNWFTLMQLYNIGQAAIAKGIRLTDFTPNSLLAVFDRSHSVHYD